jgi:ribonuclease Z
VNNGLNISIFSKALYSNWCHDKTRNILFDAGEGAATSIGNYLAGIEHIFIGHDHGDHVFGLPAIIGARNAGRGMSRNKDTMDANKPLTVYFPSDNYLMGDLIDFIKKRNGNWLRYKLDFVPISAGFEVDLGNKQFVRAFDMSHQKNKSTLGYVIYENRTRLKKEYQGLDIPSFIRKGMKNSDFNETYRANLFAYCLDAYQIPDYDQLYDVKDIIMDCTFLNLEDRDDPTHFTLDEAYDFCQGIRAKNIYAAHLSGRYNYNNTIQDNRRSNMNFVNPYRVNEL